MRSPRAEHLLVQLTGSDAPEVSALGVIGLSLLGARAGATEANRILAQAEAGPVPRAAAAYASAELAKKSQEGLLAELTEASDASLSAMAVQSLARLNSARAPRAIADALSSTDPLVSRGWRGRGAGLGDRHLSQAERAAARARRPARRATLDRLAPPERLHGCRARARARKALAPRWRRPLHARRRCRPSARARSQTCWWSIWANCPLRR